MAIKVTGAYVKVPNVAKFKKVIVDAARAINKFNLWQFKRTIVHFTHKVDFKSQVKYTSSRTTATVYTTDFPYFMLNKGNKRRYVAMIQPFAPKTSPGRIPSVKGRRPNRKPYFVRTKRKMPDVKPRAFDEQIVKLTNRELKKQKKIIERKLAKL